MRTSSRWAFALSLLAFACAPPALTPPTAAAPAAEVALSGASVLIGWCAPSRLTPPRVPCYDPSQRLALYRGECQQDLALATTECQQEQGHP